METHTIAPFYNSNSKILILGSFPSIKSRNEGFYYAHKKNRFWSVLSIIYQSKLPTTILEKQTFLKEHNIALYDVCASCEINKSSDSTIKNVTPNDIKIILEKTKITKIYLNGNTAFKLYNKYLKEKLGIDGICLPSTSPANATFSLEKLVKYYGVIAS